MRPFIFMERNGIHIINLDKTIDALDKAKQLTQEITANGDYILFVGTKKQTRSTVKEHAEKCYMPYVINRWLGGMLTNFVTIQQSIQKLRSLDKMVEENAYGNRTKKEVLKLNGERIKMEQIFGGIKHMHRLPGALFVIDTSNERIAVNEANRMGIPIIGIVDTNADPELINYPIPANDDAIRSIGLIAGAISEAAEMGRNSYTSRTSVPTEEGEDTYQKQRKRRPRKRHPGGRRPDQRRYDEGERARELHSCSCSCR